MSNHPDISIVVPLFNEEESVVPLCAAITASLDNSDYSYEAILVDDGSVDSTFSVAHGCATEDHRVKVIRFRRNFGQTPAMAAGIDFAKGRIIVTMDGDLQNDPRDILMLVREVEAGADLAVGWRHKRKDKLITRKIPSRIANWIIGKVTGVAIKDNGCSLKAYRSDIIQRVPLYSEMHRFIPAMSTLAGARVAELKVNHHPRKFGSSKYGLSRIYKVLFDLLAIKTITAYAPRAVRWFAILSAPFLVVGAVSLAWALIAGITYTQSLVVPAGLTVIYVGGAISLLIFGVLSELVYVTGQTRPTDFLGRRARTKMLHSADGKGESGA